LVPDNQNRDIYYWLNLSGILLDRAK